MNIGFSTKICPELSLEQICLLAKRVGCEHIEFQVEQNQNHGLDGTIEDSSLRNKAKSIIKQHEIKPWVIATSIVVGDMDTTDLKDSIDRILKWSGLAEFFQAPYLRVFPMHKGIVRPSALAKTLQTMAEAIAEFPVQILLETHGIVAKGKLMREILDQAGSNKVAAIWDIAHTTVHGEPVDESYSYLASYLKHVHIKDFAKMQKVGDNDNPYSAWQKFVPFGKGDLPLNQLFGILKSNDYSAVISVEMPPAYADAETCLRDAVDLFYSVQ